MRRLRAPFKQFWGIMRNDYSCDDTDTELIIFGSERYCGECEHHVAPIKDSEGVLRCNHCHSRFCWLVDINPPTVLAQMVLSYFGNQLELIQPTADHRHIVIRRRVRRHDLVAR